MIPTFDAFYTQYLRSKPFAGLPEIRQAYAWAGGVPSLDPVRPRVPLGYLPAPELVGRISTTPTGPGLLTVATAHPAAPSWLLPAAGVAAGAALWWWLS